MPKNTWLKLWRSTAKNQLIRNAKASQLFLWMLLEASWTKRREGGVNLNPGELLTSMPLIQIELNMTNKQCRDAVALLEGLRIVAHDSRFEGRGLGRGKKTIYRFINWSKYQSQTEEGRESVEFEGASPSNEVAGVEENSVTEQADSSPKKDKKEQPLAANAARGKAFTDYFWAKHLKAHLQKPVPAVWAFKKCSKLVEAIGLAEAQRRCDNFFSDPYLKTHALEDFVGAPDKWIAKRVAVQSKADTQVQIDRKRTAL